MFGTYHLIALGLFAAFAAVDLLARARAFPDVPMWKLKGIAFTLLYFVVKTYRSVRPMPDRRLQAHR